MDTDKEENMLRRKNYWLLFAILLLALTSLSPSMDLSQRDAPLPLSDAEAPSRVSSSRQTGEPVQLRISVALNEREFAELQKLSSQYELTSGAEVELTNRGEDPEESDLMHDLTVGGRPDIVMTDVHRIRELAEQGYLLPVDAYQSSPGGTPLTPLLPLVQWNGYTWGVPLDLDPYVFVYSKAALHHLGADKLPRSLEAWTTLLEQAKAAPGAYVLGMDPAGAYGLSAFLESVGSPLYPAAIKAVNWLADARPALYLDNGQSGELWKLLAEGKLGAAVMPYSVWRAHAGSDWTAETPWGQGAASGQSLLSRCFALSAQSQSPEAAADWLSYLTSQKTQMNWLQNTGKLPASSEPYLAGLPGYGGLPFNSGGLLAEAGITDEQAQAGWTEAASAAERLLAGQLDAAGFNAAVASNMTTAGD